MKDSLVDKVQELSQLDDQVNRLTEQLSMTVTQATAPSSSDQNDPTYKEDHHNLLGQDKAMSEEHSRWDIETDEVTANSVAMTSSERQSGGTHM